MTTFKDQLAVDLDAAFFNTDEFGEKVLYDDGSGPVQVSAVVDLGDGREADTDSGAILVKKAEVPAPAYRQAFTIQGNEWLINPGPGKNFILAEDDLTLTLRIQKGARFNQWRK